MTRYVFVAFIAVTLMQVCVCSLFFRQGRFKDGFIRPPPVASHHQPYPPAQWFEQRLDHFNPQDSRTWQQRFFVNDTFYKPGGPVFLQIGGEGPVNPIWMVTGSWVTYGQQYNALLIQVEHRYYGKSHPVSDLTTANLKYLSSEQALEDLANFITTYSAQNDLQDAKWIAFGGSYPGSLATWIRMKYPHLIHGAVASSAPLVATADFSQYLKVVTDALNTAKAKDCVPNIRKATEILNNLMQDADGRQMIKQAFRLCDDIDPTNKNDVANLYSELAANFEGIVQYNKDNRGFEGGVGANITLDTLCDMMSAENSHSPLDGYAKVNSFLLDTYEMKCLGFSYNLMIKQLQNTSWSSPAAFGGRQWTYQTCTEFGYYQTSGDDSQPFGHGFPLEFWAQQCADIYGSTVNEQVLSTSVNFTNANYGGLGVKVSRIIFPNGSIDPWHALSITKSLSPDAQAIFINGTAHCANMYPESDDDLPELKAARFVISKTIGSWLSSD